MVGLAKAVQTLVLAEYLNKAIQAGRDVGEVSSQASCSEQDQI